MRSRRPLFVLVATAVFVLCRLTCFGEDGGGLTPAIQRVLLDPSAGIVDVSNALRQIAPKKIDSKFLARIYNDPKFSNEHRRLCFFAVIRSLGSSSRTLAELASLLEYPKWIREQDIYEVWAVTGLPIVDIPLGGHEVTIAVFPETEHNLSCIAISFSKGDDVTKEMVYRALQGEQSPLFERVRFKEIAFREAGNFDPDPDNLKQWIKEHPEAKRPSR